MKKLAIIVTHPIQYYSPLFKNISESGQIELMVFYTWSQAQGKKYDPGFGKEVDWDIPLLDGYNYTFVNNVSKKPGSHHYKGIINPTLIAEIEKWKPDSVLIIGWNFNSHLKAMRYFKGKLPVYFRGDSTLLDEKPGLKRMARRIFLKWVYSHIDFAFYVGTRNKEYFLAHGIKEKQLVFAPHAVDNDKFLDRDGTYEKRAIEWRRSLRIKDDDFVFLFAGKLEPKKNPLLLLESFQRLNSSDSHLIFVGNGILENELKSRAKPINNSENHSTVHFIDFQNQSIMPIVYRLGNVFVLPSNGPGETWGLAVNEAMACGLPVIVSDKVGCEADLVEKGKTGFTFKSGNAREFQQIIEGCMVKYRNDTSKFELIGQDSLKKIKYYSMEVLASNMINGILKP